MSHETDIRMSKKFESIIQKSAFEETFSNDL